MWLRDGPPLLWIDLEKVALLDVPSCDFDTYELQDGGRNLCVTPQPRNRLGNYLNRCCSRCVVMNGAALQFPGGWGRRCARIEAEGMQHCGPSYDL